MFPVSWLRIVIVFVLTWALIAIGTAFARSRQPIRRSLIDGTILFASAAVFTCLMVGAAFLAGFFGLDGSINPGDRIAIHYAIFIGSMIIGAVLTVVGNWFVRWLRFRRPPSELKPGVLSSSRR